MIRHHSTMMTSSNGTFSASLTICAGNSPVTGEFPFVRGIHRSPVNSPHKGQWRGALMFSLNLICVWINRWVKNREAGDLRRCRSHYDAIVMTWPRKPCDRLHYWPFNGNPPHKWPVMPSFGVFFDGSLNNLLNKQSSGRLFGAQVTSL